MPNLAAQTGVDPHDKSASKLRKILVYTGPSTYVAGGDAITGTDAGIGVIEAIHGGVAWNGSAARLVTYDRVNGKLVWYVPNTGSEASGDLSAYSLILEVIGH